MTPLILPEENFTLSSQGRVITPLILPEENFTLPPREGDDTAYFARGKFYPLKQVEGDDTANFARKILLIEQLKRVMTPLLDLSFLNPHGSKNLTTVKTF